MAMLISDPSQVRPESGRFPGGRAKRWAAGLLFRSGAVRLAGRIRGALRGPRLVVLCYHRVAADLSMPAVSASPDGFSRQAAWFARRFDVLPADAIAAYLAGNLRLRRDSLVLTFDDGYADNYHVVLPVLRRHRMPAVFFISSDPLLLRQPYWYDLFWGRLADWDGSDLPAELLARAHARFREAWRRYAAGRSRSARQAVLDAAKSLGAETRHALSEALGARRKPGRADPACAVMTLEEARSAVGQGMAVGAHSRSHPSLAGLQPGECRAEIGGSLDDLQAQGIPARLFAYPFGTPADTGGPGGQPRQVLADLAVQGRVAMAMTTEERAVSRRDDLLLLPRKVITPQSLSQIACKLERLAWLGR